MNEGEVGTETSAYASVSRKASRFTVGASKGNG